MKDRLRGLLGFLGLVEDDYGDYGPSNTPRPFSEGQAPEPEYEPPAPTRAPAASGARSHPRVTSPAVRPAALSVLEGAGARVRPMPAPSRGVTAFAQDRDVAVVSPTSYNESQRITDLLRSNRAVVVTTLFVDAALARRLVDFTAGTAYALNASVEMLLRGVYLVTPSGTRLGPEVKERLRAANYRTSDQA